MLLCNESFASTNELEGSRIARGVVHAMVESGVRVFFVTHLYDLAHSLYARHDPGSTCSCGPSDVRMVYGHSG